MKKIIKKFQYLAILIQTLSIVKNKLDLILLIYISKNKLVKIKLNNSLTILINDISSTGVLWEVFSNLDYDVKLKKARIIIDIGAHVGIASLFFSTKYPKSYVFSIEPDPENYKLLLSNIQLNKKKNIKPFNTSVLNNNKEVVFLFKNKHSSMSHTRKDLTEVKTTNKYKVVKSVKLESFIRKNKIKNVDILKIDVEGSEYEIILNLKPSTFSKIRYIIVEYHNWVKGLSEKDLVDKLVENNYKVRVVKNRHIDGVGLIYAKNTNLSKNLRSAA